MRQRKKNIQHLAKVQFAKKLFAESDVRTYHNAHFLTTFLIKLHKYAAFKTF